MCIRDSFYFTSLKVINRNIALSMLFKDKRKTIMNVFYLGFIYLIAVFNLYFILTYNTLNVIVMLIIIMIAYYIVSITQNN